MHKEKLLEIARGILSQPTAPFHEAARPRGHRLLAQPLRAHPVAGDAFGNLIAHYQGGAATIDAGARAMHFAPTWTIRVGCVPLIPPPWRTPVGTARSKVTRPARRWTGCCSLEGCPAELAAANRHGVRDFGQFAMWDLPAFEFRDDRIYSRAIDDLMGCVAIVATLLELEESGARVECHGLFTRAEEVGLRGRD